MDTSSQKPITLVILFLLVLDHHHHHANAFLSDTDFEGTQRSRKLIQGRQQEAIVPKSQRILRTVKSPPAPKANRFRHFNVPPPPPLLV